MTRIARGVLALCFTLAGCSGDDAASAGANGPFPAAQTCGLRVELGGTFTSSLTGSDEEVGCATLFSSTGFEAIFYPRARGLTAFTLFVEDVMKGATGTAFPATVIMQTLDDIYETECTVDVVAQTFSSSDEFTDRYRVVGSGRCPAPAAGGTPNTSVSVGPFEFVAVVGWRKD
jgi:hypothetical protein